MRFFVALLAACVFTSAAQEFPSVVEMPPDERILRFHSDVVVHPDATMTVTETIQVRALGQMIHRGIYRDFPTTYWKRHERLPFRIPYRVGFDIIEVRRDGNPEPYHTEGADNGIRTYFGAEDVYLQPGIYTYTFAYKTSKQLGFYTDSDELYWNATGTGWAFPIDVAEATVHLPGDIPADQLKLFGYTGTEGDDTQDFRAQVTGPSEVHFISTVPLQAFQGLTIGVTFPKGHVQAPHWSDYLISGKSNIIAIAGLVILAIYYAMAWVLVGIDPSRGRVLPTDTPPQGFSPAALRYIQRMAFDKDTFMVAVVNMATKGYLRIEQDEGRNGTYHLVRDQAPDDVLAPEELAIARELFRSRDSIELERSNHAILRKAINALEESLKAQYKDRYFKTNSYWRLPAFLLSIGCIVGAVLLEDGEAKFVGLFTSVWLMGWTVGCTALAIQVFQTWRRVIRERSIVAALGGLFITAFAVPFFLGEAFGLGAFALNVSAGVTIALVLMIVLNVTFFYLLKAPTREGRAVLDQWEGFALQLKGQRNLLHRQNDADAQHTLFEEYLPFALALGEGAAWATAFADAANAASIAPSTRRRPLWYHGPLADTWRADHFVANLNGSFSGAIASSSVAPGSSSGSSGGSSGGGGGGGGGGGW